MSEKPYDWSKADKFLKKKPVGEKSAEEIAEETQGEKQYESVKDAAEIARKKTSETPKEMAEAEEGLRQIWERVDQAKIKGAEEIEELQRIREKLDRGEQVTQEEKDFVMQSLPKSVRKIGEETIHRIRGEKI